MKKIYLTEVVLLTKSYNLQDFKDWLHWHLDIIGFDCAHIFDNESSVDIKSVCDEYGDKVTYEKIEGWPDQYSLYNRYINNESPAWWVLPIDDDEFLYVSDTYHNKVNKMILSMQLKYKDMIKFSIGWRNMFPVEYTEVRTKSLIENAVGWSDDICREIFSYWRQDNRWIKTFVCTTKQYTWGHNTNEALSNGGHNPICLSDIEAKSYFCNGILSKKNCEDTEDVRKRTYDVILLHYQYKSEQEWQYKCLQRKSPANINFDKNKPLAYKKIYTCESNIDIFNEALELWKKHK